MRYAMVVIAVLLSSSLSGCLSSVFGDEVSCPENPPDGATCAKEEYDNRMFGIGVDFTGMDLSEGNFTGAVLAYANFRGADLSGADFEGANLRGADFSGADLSGTSFAGAFYDSGTIWDKEIDQSAGLIFLGPGAELDGVNLDNMRPLSWSPAFEAEFGITFPSIEPIDLSGSSLVGASIRDSWIFVADFSGSDLSGANFLDSSILLVNFSNADLTGANLSGIELSLVDFTGADLTGADLFDFDAQLLRGCPSKLPDGWHCLSPEIPPKSSNCPPEEENIAQGWVDYLDELNLDMSNCNYLIIGPTSKMGGLRWIDGFNLSEVDLSERPLEYISAVNLTGCPSKLYDGYICAGRAILGPRVMLYDVDLSGINLSGVNLTEAMLFGVNLSNANLSGADLSGVSLFDANLSGANLDGSDIFNVFWNGNYNDETQGTICPDGSNSLDNDVDATIIKSNYGSCENNL